MSLFHGRLHKVFSDIKQLNSNLTIIYEMFHHKLNTKVFIHPPNRYMFCPINWYRGFDQEEEKPNSLVEQSKTCVGLCVQQFHENRPKRAHYFNGIGLDWNFKSNLNRKKHYLFFSATIDTLISVSICTLISGTICSTHIYLDIMWIYVFLLIPLLYKLATINQ